MDEIASVKLSMVGYRPIPPETIPRSCLAACANGLAWRVRWRLIQNSCFSTNRPLVWIPIAAAQFDELVRDLQQSLRLTVFMVTHDIDTLRATTDRIAVLVDRKIKVGTIASLVHEPHPWIHEYFTGARGRAALATQ